MLQIRRILMQIELIHLVFLLQLLNEIGVWDYRLLQSFVLFVLFSLREHEGAELLKMALQVGCVLLFLKIAQMSVFHRRY